jgi:hypothetical protein
LFAARTKRATVGDFILSQSKKSLVVALRKIIFNSVEFRTDKRMTVACSEKYENQNGKNNDRIFSLEFIPHIFDAIMEVPLGGSL